MNITVVQPKYFSGERPDEKIADFLIGEMEKVINEADVCLYKAKKAGRNRVEYGYYNK